MNKDKALKMAIEALENSLTIQDVAINACKEALEQPEGKEFFERGKEIARWADKQVQEPVGYWQGEFSHLIGTAIMFEVKQESVFGRRYPNIPLYTHPHQWQGLTDDDVIEICSTWNELNGSSYADLCRAIEQALKEKNT